MKTLYPITIIAVFLLLSTNGLMNGQNKIDGYSFNPKLNPSSVNESTGDGLGCEINVLRTHYIYSINYYSDRTAKSYYRPSNNDSLNYIYHQIDFMIGKYIGDRFLRFQYQGGLGVFWGNKHGNESEKHFMTLGIPLKLGFKILPARFISLGIDLQANLNIEKSVFMPMLSVEIGKLRNKIVR